MTLWLGMSVPALALPSQSISTVLAWSKKHALVAPLQKARKLEPDEPDYESVIQIGGAIYNSNERLIFSVVVNPRSQKVESETIYYANPQGIPSLDFYTGAGFRLIEAIYDRSVMNDFVKAQLVKTRKLGNTIPIRLYRGKQFGYQVMGGGSSDSTSNFTIASPAQFEKLLTVR
ncbi:MAG: hypothetical protein SFW36_19045 [Leptolyngbyaceae cyanobacterium bins.59]|nr:hypothetical protein [Leptolyngbyaceae cyanobacterium bins.59]